MQAVKSILSGAKSSDTGNQKKRNILEVFKKPSSSSPSRHKQSEKKPEHVPEKRHHVVDKFEMECFGELKVMSNVYPSKASTDPSLLLANENSRSGQARID